MFGYQVLRGGNLSFSSLTFLASATSTTDSITIPSSVDEGDVLILVQKSRNSSTTIPSDVTPSGWTHVGTSTFNPTWATRLSIKFKIAAAGDGGSSVTGMDATTLDSKIILAFRGNAQATSGTANDYSGTIENTDPTSQSITAGSGAAPLIVIGCYGAQTTGVTSQSFSPAEDGSVTEFAADDSNYAYYKIYNDSPSNVTIDTGDEGVHNVLAGFYLEVS